MLVLTLDPGVTTGYVECIPYDQEAKILVGQERLEHEDFFKFLNERKPDIIVYERFEYRRNLGNANLFSRELIGIVNLYASNKLVRLYDQMPNRKDEHFKNKDRIKELNLWVPNCPHGMDALRHFLMWWTFGSGYQYNKGQKLVLV